MPPRREITILVARREEVRRPRDHEVTCPEILASWLTHFAVYSTISLAAYLIASGPCLYILSHTSDARLKSALIAYNEPISVMDRFVVCVWQPSSYCEGIVNGVGKGGISESDAIYSRSRPCRSKDTYFMVMMKEYWSLFGERIIDEYYLSLPLPDPEPAY